MGHKKINNFKLIDSVAMTGTATIESDIQNVENFDNIGLQISWTGTPTGTFTVKASNDRVTFYDLTFTPPLTNPSGGSGGGQLVNINQLPYRFMKFVYVNSVGSGVLNVTMQSKDIN